MPEKSRTVFSRLTQITGHLLVAFVTGFVSLVWQTTALRIGIQEIGANRSTSAAILATALLGLAIGAIVFGKLADRLKNPVRLAASLLAMVSIFMLMFAFFGRTLAAELARSLSNSESVKNWTPLIFSALVILPVHLCLGGIIPAMMATCSNDQSAHPAAVRRKVATLYALETMGAAVGAILTVFTLVPVFGIFQTLIGCSVLGLVTAAFGVIFAGSSVLQTHDQRSETPTVNVPVVRSWHSMTLSVAVLLSSFASLGMELIWQRYFVFVFGSDSRSYAVVVAVMLIGISVGSSIAGLKIIQGRTRSAYCLCLIAIASSIATSLIVLRYGMKIETIQANLNWLLLSPLYARFGLAIAVLLLPAIGIGFAFPLASELWIQRSQRISTGIGKLYALVAIGNVVGIFSCASLLIPSFGLQRSAIVLAVLPLIGGLLMVWPNGKRNLKSQLSLSIATAFAFAICVSLLIFAAKSPSKAGLVQQDGWKEVFYFEDSAQTVAVIESKSDPATRKLLIDGVTIGESGGGVDEKQQLLAHLPFLLKKDAAQQNVYTIGLGTGILASELAEHPLVESVIATELSPGVIAAVEYFSDRNQKLTANEKVQIVNDDGIRYLKRAASKFDVIVSDGKSRPGAASNVAFFSKEYYQLCESRLKDDGLFLQWVSIKCDRTELATILHTFADVFPFGHIGFASPSSVYLVGSLQEIDLDESRISSRLQRNNASSLRKYGWNSADDILSMYWLDQSVLRPKFLGNTSPNTFDRPVLELVAWDSFRYSVQQLPPQVSLLEELIEHDTESFFNGVAIDSNSTLSKARQAGREILRANATTLAAKENWLDSAAKHWQKAIGLLPDLTRQHEFANRYRALAAQAAQANDTTTEFSALLNLTELKCSSADDRLRLAMILESHAAYDEALQHHYAAVKQADEKVGFRIAFAECLMFLKKYQQAKQQLESAAEESSNETLAFKKAKLLTDICSFKSEPNGQELIPTIALRASEHDEFSELLTKFEVNF